MADNKGAIVLNEVKKAVVGKDEVLEKVFMAIISGGHILLEDVPGVGKTTLALAFSKAMGMTYKRVQFTPDTMASDVLGFSIYNKEKGNFEYKKGAVFCNFFLGDEINRTSAKTQAALLEAMEELHVTVDGVTYDLPNPFVCIATQNPLGSAGTHNLPDSQLDRFMIKVSMGYPSIENQIDIVKQREHSNPLDTIETVVSTDEIIKIKNDVSECFIDDALIKYAAELCERTRNIPDVEQGVSPRAVLALVQMAKAKAFMSNRNYVVPDDVKAVFVDVCAHRLILSPKAKIKRVSAADILNSVIKEVTTPAVTDKKIVKVQKH